MIKVFSRINKIKTLSIFTILAGFAFLIWRARYGYSFNDEPFIITLAQRLLRGDKLIVDEWHPVQLFGIVVLPILKIYYLLNGSTEGLLLFARFCFCAIWFFTGLCIYFVGRKYSRFSIGAYVYWILFAPFDYMTCSYSSFGLIGIILLACLFLQCSYSADNKKNAILIGVAASVLSCIVVLCSPYCVVFFFLLIIVLLILGKRFFKEKWSFYRIVLFSCAICFVVLGMMLFYVFSLMGNTVGKIISELSFVFADPSHNESLFEKLISTVASMHRPLLVLYAIGIVQLILYAISPKVRENRKWIALYWAVVFIISRIAIASMAIDKYSFNYEMLDLGIASFVAFILLKNKPWRMFFSFSCGGLLYAVCTYTASNTKLMSLSAAIVPCGVAGIYYIIMLAREFKEDLPCDKKAAAAVVVCLMMLCQFTLQFCVRTNRQFWDHPLPELTQSIKRGAAKGLKTTPVQCLKYEETYTAVKTLLDKAGNTTDRRFLSLSSNPIIYLDADLDYGTFSAWTFGYGEKLDVRLKQYYDAVPENIPDLVYYTDEEANLISIFDKEEFNVYDYNDHHLMVRKTLGD